MYLCNQREREKLHNAPNDEDVYDCKFIQQAKEQRKLICNPIYQWTDADIWTFIRERGMKYNPLYDRGFHRIGCIGCPLSTKTQLVLELYPIYRDNYKRAFQRMLDKRKADGKDDSQGNWKDVESLYKWWIQDNEIEGQMKISDFMNGGAYESV